MKPRRHPEPQRESWPWMSLEEREQPMAPGRGEAGTVRATWEVEQGTTQGQRLAEWEAAQRPAFTITRMLAP